MLTQILIGCYHPLYQADTSMQVSNQHEQKENTIVRPFIQKRLPTCSSSPVTPPRKPLEQ